MTHKLFSEIIENEARFLRIDGYSLREVDRNIWFEKQTESGGFRISFSYTEYGDTFHLSGLKALKRFNEIESILQKILGENLIDYYTVYAGPDELTIPPGLPYTKTVNNFHFEVTKVSDLHLFLRFVEVFYEKTVHPFYAQYQSINDVYSKIKELKREQLSSFINSGSNLIFSRLFLILYLCDRSKGEEYYSEISNDLTKRKGNRSMERILDILTSVKREIKC